MAETRLITFWEGKSRDEINYLFPFRSYFWRPREAGFNPGILIVCGHEMRWPSAPLVCPSFICGPGSRHKKDWIPALCSSCWQSLSRDFPPPPRSCDWVSLQDGCWPYGNTATLAGCRRPGVRHREELTNQHSWAALRALILEWLVKIIVHILHSIPIL